MRMQPASCPPQRPHSAPSPAVQRPTRKVVAAAVASPVLGSLPHTCSTHKPRAGQQSQWWCRMHSSAGCLQGSKQPAGRWPPGSMLGRAPDAACMQGGASMASSQQHSSQRQQPAAQQPAPAASSTAASSTAASSTARALRRHSPLQTHRPARACAAACPPPPPPRSSSALAGRCRRGSRAQTAGWPLRKWVEADPRVSVKSHRMGTGAGGTNRVESSWMIPGASSTTLIPNGQRTKLPHRAGFGGVD